MSDRRLILYMSFTFVLVLAIISGILIFTEKGGAAKFDILGQEFSSTNIGLAVLFLSTSLFLGVVKFSGVLGPAQKAGDQSFTSSSEEGKISWNELISSIHKLVLKLTAADGFRPDLVIGICGGGLVVADIVAKRLGHIPCISLWPDRHGKAALSFDDGQAKRVNALNFDGLIRANGVKRILLIDDVVYAGGTIRNAVEFLKNKSKLIQDGSVIIKTASIFVLREASFQPDFAIIVDTRSRKMMPSSDRLRPFE